MLIQYHVRKPLKELTNKMGSVRITLWRIRVSSRTRKHGSFLIAECSRYNFRGNNAFS